MAGRKSKYRAVFSLRKGGFHKWLGKSEDDPITNEDIEKGLKAGGHPAKMALFARNARKFKH